MTDDSEQEHARAAEEARRAAHELARSAEERARAEAEQITADAERITADALTGESKEEGLRQLGVIYGGLILIGVYMVQPFLVAPSLDASAYVSVVAFAVAIPLLAALILLNRQETFRSRRANPSPSSSPARSPRGQLSWASSPASGTSRGSQA